MLTEVTPSLKVRLASLKLVVSSVMKEIESIERELIDENALPLPAQEWLPLAEVAKLFGFKSSELCRQWAKRNDIESKKIGNKVFISRAELDAKLKAAPTPAARPVVKHVKKPVRDESVEATLSMVFGGKR